MHANQRTADINSGSGTHFLHQNRMFKRLPAVGCPAAARMGLRHGVHLFITILFGSFLLDDNGAIQVFAALGRQIDALRERGIRTCVLSNNNPASMKYIRRMFTADGKTMEEYFDAVYLSYELHELKPSEAIFRKMIAAGGMRPEETLFIDDGQKNVEAARELGFSVYMPAPGEDFGHILENLNRYEENL